MTERKDRTADTGLEAFFDAARQESPDPGADLLARVEADALAHLPRPGTRSATGLRFFGQLRAAVGGWPGVAGLAAASVTGLWLGISPPDGVSDLLAGSGAGALSLDPLSEFDLTMLEG